MYWYVEGLIVYEKLIGSVTLADLNEVTHLFHDLASSTGHRNQIHIIVDLEGVNLNLLDMNIKDITESVQTGRQNNIGWVLLVDARTNLLQKMSNMIMTIISQTFSLRYRYFTNPEDAIMFLASLDDRVLDWLNNREIVSYRNPS